MLDIIRDWPLPSHDGPAVRAISSNVRRGKYKNRGRAERQARCDKSRTGIGNWLNRRHRLSWWFSPGKVPSDRFGNEAPDDADQCGDTRRNDDWCADNKRPGISFVKRLQLWQQRWLGIAYAGRGISRAAFTAGRRKAHRVEIIATTDERFRNRHREPRRFWAVVCHVSIAERPG